MKVVSSRGRAMAGLPSTGVMVISMKYLCIVCSKIYKNSRIVIVQKMI